MHFIDCCTESEKQKGYKGTEWLSVVSPCGCVAAWELQLAAPAQHQGTVLHSVLLAWVGKKTKFKIWSAVSAKCALLLPHCKVKKF